MQVNNYLNNQSIIFGAWSCLPCTLKVLQTIIRIYWPTQPFRCENFVLWSFNSITNSAAYFNHPNFLLPQQFHDHSSSSVELSLWLWEVAGLILSHAIPKALNGTFKGCKYFEFQPDRISHFGVMCPGAQKKILMHLHFQTWISLRPVGQSWSNFMCSISGVGERLH